MAKQNLKFLELKRSLKKLKRHGPPILGGPQTNKK